MPQKHYICSHSLYHFRRNAPILPQSYCAWDFCPIFHRKSVPTTGICQKYLLPLLIYPFIIISNQPIKKLDMDSGDEGTKFLRFPQRAGRGENRRNSGRNVAIPELRMKDAFILKLDGFPTLTGREDLWVESGWYHGTDKFPSEQSGGNFFIPPQHHSVNFEGGFSYE